MVFCLGFTISCNSGKPPTAINKCKTFPPNDFSEAIIVSLESVVNHDTVFFNELRYLCVYNSSYTKKGMYDSFGKWDEMINPEYGRISELVWKDVKLFEDDTLRFQVAAGGIESRYEMYASVMVFDENGNDMLREGSPYVEKIIDLFAGYIFDNDNKNMDFYRQF